MGEDSKIRRALVLAGGGARGAYEVGVLSYVLADLGPRLDRPPRLDIISGSSVGAVNGCYLAAHAEKPDYDIEGLARVWRNLRVRDYLRVRYRELLHVASSLLGIGGPFGRPNQRRPLSGGRLGGLLNTTSLDHLVRRHVTPSRIYRNVQAGHLEAATVSATEVATGRTICFVDRAGPLPDWTRDPRRTARTARIQADHALASAAIPFLFPAVRIEGSYFCDGSLRQNTPLSPSLRLGATRVLVISLRYEYGEGETPASLESEHEGAYPNALFLFGKLLNALLLDPIRYDLTVLERFNAVLRQGIDRYGDDFPEELARAVLPTRGKAYRIVDDILIEPSQDIGRLAARVASELGWSHWGVGPASHLFRRLADVDADAEADLLSYLFFDGAFAARLIELGRRDAARHEDQLRAFFSDEPYPYQ